MTWGTIDVLQDGYGRDPEIDPTAPRCPQAGASGKKVGTISNTGIAIGKRHFLLAFGASYKPESSPYTLIPDNDGRNVTVSEGGGVVLEGAAPTEKHCPGTKRIAMYLVWRQVVMEKLLGK